MIGQIHSQYYNVIIMNIYCANTTYYRPHTTYGLIRERYLGIHF